MSATGPATRSAQRVTPGALAIGLRRVRIELLTFTRDREAAFFTLILPVLLLVVFGSAFSGNVAPGVSFSQYFLAGMIASGVVYTAFQNLAITISQERDDGTLKRLQGTPMPKAAYFIGKVGLVLVLYVGQVTLLIALGVALFDVHLPDSAADWWTFTWVSVLGLVCCTLLGVAFTGVTRTGRGAPALVSPVVLVLQFTSGVFFQYDELPPWMQQLAALFPLKWLCQGMRSVFLPDTFQRQELAGSWELGRVALVLLAWTVLALVLAMRGFRWRRRDEL
ncbi:MAG TPA: ABC transporter permease [Actinomycetes bacterium]|nr:ABC transporter permease [Actinomycetes bacterium]